MSEEKEEYLFSLSYSEYEDYLEEGPIDEELINAFDDEGYEVKEDAELIEKDNKWRLIEDGEETFTIRRDEDKLNIYKEDKRDVPSDVGFFLGKGDISKWKNKDQERFKEIFKEQRDQNKIAKNFEGITCDLRVGDEAFVSTDDKIIDVEDEGGIMIPPGTTAVIQVYEYLKIPADFMGFLTFRFRHKQKGLVNVSGFHVDPGFKGYLALSVYNAGPNNVYFKYKEEVFTIFFFKLHKEVNEDIADREPMTDLPSEAIEYLSGPPVNIYQLNKKVEKLENRVSTYTKILILIATGLVASLLAYVFTG